MKSFQKEVVVAVLLVATLLMVLANRFIVRTATVMPDQDWFAYTSDDSAEGGQSISVLGDAESAFELEYDVDSSYRRPYAILCIRPSSEERMDLSWAETIRITASGNEHLLFQIRSYDPAFSSADDFVSRKYNEALISIDGPSKEVVLSANDFYVPSWWRERYASTNVDGRVNLKAVEWFEFLTSKSGEGTFSVESISIEGHWIPTAALNQGLLWTWMVFILGWLVYRVRSQRLELARKWAIQEQLRKDNDLLVVQSEKYSEMAKQDPLTGLLNRFGIRDVILGVTDQCLKSKEDYSLVLFDLDHFKEINDQHGHSYGDKVLCDIARITRLRLRANDSIARWGGDEFLIVLPNTQAHQAAKLAEYLRQEFAKASLEYTCSFGVCQANHNEGFIETFKRADAAMYRSKHGGRSTIKICDKHKRLQSSGRATE